MSLKLAAHTVARVRRFFYDTEFIEDGTTIDLVSIGVVDETGREFYAVSTQFDPDRAIRVRSEEHTSELQSLAYLVCRLLLEKKKKKILRTPYTSTQHHRSL